ncbi:MAG TPA: biotin/lipoyl-containing protein [Anseongella sp.]|nr:biotin/lipoyl-containing protein [Anseongella sp.]
MGIEVIVNDGTVFRIEEKDGGMLVNGRAAFPDIVEIQAGRFHVLLDNHSYNVELIDFDRAAKSGQLKVNGKLCTFSVRDRFDKLLEKLGMAGAASTKINDLKAPMPGLVLKTLVSPGQDVKKGDNLVVLEAMKMENIIKSPGDGKISVLCVKAGESVEKNEVLIKFEA